MHITNQDTGSSGDYINNNEALRDFTAASMSVEGEGRNLEDDSDLMQGIEMGDSPQEGKAAERRIGDEETRRFRMHHQRTPPHSLLMPCLEAQILQAAALLSPPKAARATKAKSKSKSKTAVVSKPTKRKSRAEPKTSRFLPLPRGIVHQLSHQARYQPWLTNLHPKWHRSAQTQETMKGAIQTGRRGNVR
jgi:hypothetical protein